MAVTPLIKPIANSRGILYTMQSAINDITTAFAHDTKRFRMSKFALINIPAMQVPDAPWDSAVQLNAVGDEYVETSAPIYGGITRYLAESFENYCLNFEAVLMSQRGYSAGAHRTVSERVFWKWLKETGAMRYRAANSMEMNSDLPIRYVEEDEYNSAGFAYNRVVKYIADIDVINVVQDENAYTEFYVYVPTHVGTCPYVLFNSVSDSNYAMSDPATLVVPGAQLDNMVYYNTANSTLDKAYLSGRHYSDVHPMGLSMNAQYDYAFEGTEVYSEITDPLALGATSPAFVPGYFFNDNSLTPYSYYTDNLITYNRYSVGDCRNRMLRRTKKVGGSPVGAPVTFVRSNLDGIVIDFEKTSYKVLNDNPSMMTFSDFASGNGSLDFNYNAILLYYEIYDPADPTASITNLYGVQFLSQPIQSGTYYRLPSIEKRRPDAMNKINGSAFSHKINLKFDTSAENAAVEHSINDYNTLSLHMYLDALTAMRRMADAYSANLYQMQATTAEVISAKQMLLDSANVNEVNARLDIIEQSLAANSALFENTNGVMQLIQQLFAMYNGILANNTSLTVNYNFDPMVLNNLVVLNQEYNLKIDSTQNYGNIISIGVPKMLQLVRYSNYFRHESYVSSPSPSPESIGLTSNTDVYIDDATFAWESGQSFEIVVSTPIDVGRYYIVVRTDARNKTNGGIFGKTIISLDATYFNSANGYMPIFRILCVDANSLDFRVDKIR